MNSEPGQIKLNRRHLTRIPDHGVTENLVVFADDAVLAQQTPADRSILDIGCGRGVFTAKLARTGAAITGIDIEAEEIAQAEHMNKPPGVEYRCMAAEELAGLPATFDLVVSRFCFHHLTFPEAASNIKSCLKPGGRLYIVDCYEKFWSLGGRLSVLSSALEILGPVEFMNVFHRLGYFFSAKRIQHVRSDIRRLKTQERYTYDQLCGFYEPLFPGCVIAPLGPAFSLSWKTHSGIVDHAS